MVVILMALVFIAQLICCIAVKHKVKKYLPTLIVAGLMSVAVLSINFGELNQETMVTLSMETMMLLAGCFAAVLHLSISLLWKRMKDRK